MTSSNPNSPTNSPLNFRPFAIGKRGQKFRFIPTNSVGLSKPVITQALQTGGDAIQVTWGESGGTSYALQVSTNGGTTFSDVTTTAATSFTHTGLSFPGSYTYRVRATVDAEVSDWSDSVTETMVDVPAAPGGLTVTGATTSSISLSWNDTADEGSYSIEASVDGLGSWSGVGSTGQNVVTFTHSGLSESVQRHYRVTAFNKAGGSIPSSTANSWTVPAAPTGLTATVISSTQINLAWTDVSTGNQSYKVERSTDNVNWTEIATGLSATATTYSATGLTASTLYYFRVRAANAVRNSSYTSSASATTQSGTSTYNVEYLVVAGGGGGGIYGGGGAGGYRTATGFSLTVGTSYTVTVGAGGTGGQGNTTNNRGTNGSNSVFSTITSDGGGGGGAADPRENGLNGGSGGGGGMTHPSATGGAAGTATSGQGNAGGAGLGNPNYAGGGGGGAGAAGVAATTTAGGNGGAGSASSITGTSVTRGGGGGGGRFGGTPHGTGGSGGGGAGGGTNNGSVNLGGGGGGRGTGADGAIGGSGGSGVVVLRMPTANYSGSTTGSPSVTTSGSDTILTYNASGTYTA